jgi:DNA polymerase-1
MQPLYLIDASIYIFRAYFSIPEHLTDAEGNPANAVYGFAGFLAMLLEKTQAAHIAVAFDESLTTSFRNEIYPPYKANRALPPPELEAQLAACQELARAMGLETFVSPRYESDDLIGTASYAMREQGFRAVIVSGDKDLTQLIGAQDMWWDFTRDRQLDAAGIKRQFGVTPQQIVDLIALMGDSVDNIPGVPGIGPKTAVALLSHFGSLAAIYDRLEEIPRMNLRGAPRVHTLIKDNQESALLSQRLARIATDAPIECTPQSLARQSMDRVKLEELCDRLNFGKNLRSKLQAATDE